MSDLDFSSHQNFLHNTESVYLYSNFNGGYNPITISNALRTGLFQREGESSGGVYTHRKVGWQIPPFTAAHDIMTFSTSPAGQTGEGTYYGSEMGPYEIVQIAGTWYVAKGSDKYWASSALTGTYLPVTDSGMTGSGTVILGETTVEPKPGDEILATDYSFKVISVQKPIFNSFWGLDTIKLDITEELKDMVTWYRQTDGENDYGDKIMTPTILSDNLAARVQPDPAHIGDMLGKRGSIERYLVYTLSDQEPQYGDYFTIVGESPQYTYKVVGWHGRKSLEDLTVCECIIQP